VLFIILDDYREIPGSFSTPNIDKLKSEGVEFSNAFSNFPQCGPSRYSFMSGRYPFNTGFESAELLPVLEESVDTFDGSLFSSVAFLPKVFKDAGYLVGSTGKVFHLPQSPTEWYDFLDDRWDNGSPQGKVPYAVCKTGNKVCACHSDTCSDYQTKENAVNLVHEWSNRSESWILFAGFVRPHTDFEFDADKINLQSSNATFKTYSRSSYPSSGIHAISQISWAEMPWMRDVSESMQNYLRSVFSVDAYIGQVLDALSETNQDEDTLVVLISDHGMHLGDLFPHFGKWTLLDASLKVPLVLRIPYWYPATLASSVEDVVELVDIFPTLIEFAQIETSEPIDGESLFSTNRQKHEAFSLIQSCENKLSKDTRRRKPCSTIKRGATAVNAVGFSIRTKHKRLIEWRKSVSPSKVCMRMKSKVKCEAVAGCAYKAVHRLKKKFCVASTKPDGSGVDFRDTESFIAAEEYDSLGRTNYLDTNEDGKFTTTKFLEVIHRIYPTLAPSGSPSESPSVFPSKSPSISPSKSPSVSPSASPSIPPSATPSTSPSESPSLSPSESSSIPSVLPSESPSISPSAAPSVSPSGIPSISPTTSPSKSSSESPSKSPLVSPSFYPSESPSISSSGFP